MKRILTAIAGLLLGLAEPALAQGTSPNPSFAIERPDGSRITYHVERRMPRRRQPILLMLQGSGCDSVAANARIRWMAPLIAPRHALLTIEKYGVGPGSSGEACSTDFWRRNTIQQRVVDALQVAGALRGREWWNGELVLFGGSEGGAVAAMLAPLLPETRAVIIWSSGIGLPVGEMIRSALPPVMRAEAERVFPEARVNPTGDRQWAGASYRWWADAVDLVPARSLLQTRAPVLLLHGARDESAPVASARAARDLLLAGGKTNFTYREYDGYDHFMNDASGVDRRAQVLAEAAAWLRHLPRR